MHSGHHCRNKKSDPNKYSESKLDSIAGTFFPSSMNLESQRRYLQVQVNLIFRNLGNNKELIKMLFADKTGSDARDYILSTSKLMDKNYRDALLKGSPEDVLNSDDPVIKFILTLQRKNLWVRKINKEILPEDAIQQPFG
ncbi:MAG: S46 family peptidase [Ignavibacteriales bacterium]|nr:S46 family peptidase [Ignavibacteriales bacterium]